MLTAANSRNLYAIRAVPILIGFTAVTAQIVFLRELIVVFYGNEISLGILLASWLLWTAAGSSFLARLTTRIQSPLRLVAVLQALLSIALPVTIFVVRASKRVFPSLPGEILGPGPMLLTSLVALSSFCLVSGCLFAAATRLYATESGIATAEATGSVYLLEAIGSGVGGALTGLVLIRYWGSFDIALMLAVLNLAVAAGLAVPKGRLIAAALVAASLSHAASSGSRWLEAQSLAQLWKGFRLVATRNSVYGNLTVIENEGSRSVYENGLVLFNAPDQEAAEETVHYALLQHPAPKSLLLIGGGVNGSIVQALQHPGLERVDYVELDPAVIELARTWLPVQWASIRSDPRVHVQTTDGRLFLKTSEETFDVIIVNLPDPQTAQLNRFYTAEFFQEAARKLSPGGVFSFRLTGAENYISPELGRFLQCVNKTLRSVFAGVVTIPGPAIHFFAATRPGVLVGDAEGLVERLRSRHIQTSYVREYYIPFRMMPDRMADLAARIRPEPSTQINRDFTPIAYYFDVTLWSSRFQGSYKHWFESIARVRFSVIAIITGLLLIAAAGTMRWLPGKGQRARATAGFAVASMGLTMTGLEMLLLLAFQAIYGYVYQQLGIVIASFMVGLALGSWLGVRRTAMLAGIAIDRRDMRALGVLQIVAAVSGIALCLLFDALAGATSRVALVLVSNVLFPLLALLAGLLGGFQFPLACRVFVRDTRSPGTLYALDLLGACLAAIAFSTYLVPVFGFFNAAVLMALWNGAPAILALRLDPEPA